MIASCAYPETGSASIALTTNNRLTTTRQFTMRNIGFPPVAASRQYLRDD
jgi:hypothetical protein